MDKIIMIGRQEVGHTFCRIRYENGCLSITGVEGPLRNGDARGACGQIDLHDWHFLEYAPGFDASIVSRFREVWRKWHLNDMQAGSPRQRAWIEANPLPVDNSRYETYSNALSEAGLNPDPEYIHEGRPYVYGSAWLTTEVPAEVLSFLESLPNTDRAAHERPEGEEINIMSIEEAIEMDTITGYLQGLGVTVTVEFNRYGIYEPFNDDRERDIYSVKIKRGSRSYSFEFGQSEAASRDVVPMSTDGRTGRPRILRSEEDIRTAAEVEVWQAWVKHDRRSVRIMQSCGYTYVGRPRSWKKGDVGVFLNPDYAVPTAADVFSGLTWHEPGDFAGFCADHDYNDDSIKAHKLWQAAQHEYAGLAQIFSEAEMTTLAEMVLEY